MGSRARSSQSVRWQKLPVSCLLQTLLQPQVKMQLLLYRKRETAANAAATAQKPIIDVCKCGPNPLQFRMVS
jgi:hypothetical protein